MKKLSYVKYGDFNVDCNKMMSDKNLRLLREFIND